MNQNKNLLVLKQETSMFSLDILYHNLLDGLAGLKLPSLSLLFSSKIFCEV